ncbi:MAG: glycosyltransferase family 39 protein, partial [Candidatus Aminicenantes bacterium]|nr:glycosyltransferase family 39 protein [Candidatus Aminicenantes bacterium]
MKKKGLVFVLVLISCLFLIYQHSLKFDLIWDTKTFVNESILLNNEASLFSAFKYGYIYGQLGMQTQSFYYRPIVNLSFMIEKEIWGLNGVTLRLTNIIIFSLAIFFLFWFLKRQGEGIRFSSIVMLLFALSPLNVENIIWIVGRCDLFLLLWGMLTFLFFQLFLEKKKVVYVAASLFFFALGIFSKETFVFFWPLLLVYEWSKLKRISPFYHISTAVLSILFYIIKIGVLGIGGLHFVVGSSVLDYIKTAISVFGYYSRILLFPFYFDNFSFVNEVTTTWYIFLGIVMGILILTVFYITKKDRKNLFPLSLTVLFMCPYILLTFTTLWPFRISSRYMMIPFLGVIWLFTRAICRLKIKFQNIIIISLVILFGSAIISSTQRYRTERNFWEDALKSHSDNSFVLQKMANICYEEKDDFTSLYYYNQALKYPMGQTTAIEISIGLAKLAFQRCDYQKSLEWLNRFHFKVLPYQEYHIIKLKALILVSLGNINQAVKLLKENLNAYSDRRDIYHLLFEFQIGFENWLKAKNLENMIKMKFPPPYRE